jgi:hypothetical protein
LTTSEQSIKTTTIPERRIESKLPQEKFTKLTTQSQTTVTTTEDQGDDEDDEDDDEEDVTKSPDNKVKNGNLLQVVQDSGDDEKSIAEVQTKFYSQYIVEI